MSNKKKLPLSVIQARGKTALTKAEIEKRKKNEELIRGKTDNIKPPSYLTDEEKQEFNDISSQLAEMGIFSNLDCDMLGVFLSSKSEYLKVDAAIKGMDPVETTDEFRQANEMYLKLVRIKKSLFDECRSVANDMGLTITSRLKLEVPGQEEKEETEFEKRFGNL